MSVLVKEPLVHFLVIGVLVFAFSIYAKESNGKLEGIAAGNQRQGVDG